MRSARIRAFDRTSPVFLTLGAALAVWVAVTALGRGSKLPVALVVIATGGVLLLQIRSLAWGLAIVLGATLVPDTAITITIGNTRLDAVVLLVVFLLVRAFFETVMDQGRPTAAELRRPVLIFGLALAQGAVVAWVRGGDRGSILTPMLVLLVVLIAYPVHQELQARGTRRLTNVIIAAAAVGSGYTLLAAVLKLPLPQDTALNEVITLAHVTRTQRLRPAVLALVLLALLLVIGRTVVSGRTAGRTLLIALFVAVEAVSFNRSTWVPLALAAVVLMRLAPGDRVPLGGLRRGLSAIAIVVTLFVASTSGLLGSTAKEVTARISSTVNPAVLSEPSYLDRVDETAVAIETGLRHPLFGVGLGRPYGVRRTVIAGNPPQRITYDRLFIHNSWLGVWLQLGLLGVAAFVLFGIAIVRSLREADRSNPNAYADRLAGGVAAAAMALQGLFQTSIYSQSTMLVLGLSIALAVSGPRRRRGGDRPFLVPSEEQGQRTRG